MSRILTYVQRKSLLLNFFLIALLFFIPAYVNNQAIVGPLVNATLLISLFYLGQDQAFFLAILPSTAALSSGLLPVLMAPMIPFVFLSNIIYLKIFAILEKKSDIGAVLVAAICKTLFLTFVVQTLMLNLLSPTISDKLIDMMTWPQLWTATVGGLLALLIKKYVRV
jgi:hypothetical protein